MADIVSSLFGLDPNEIVALRQKEDQANALRYGQGQRNPGAATTGYGFGAGLSRGLMSGLGIQDPALEKATKLQQILSDAQSELGPDVNDQAKLLSTVQQKLAQDPRFAQEALQVGAMAQKAAQEQALSQAKIGQEQAQTKKYEAEAAAKKQEIDREEAGRQAILSLQEKARAEGRVPTQEELMGTFAPYMSIDKLAALSQGSADKAAYREDMIKQAQIAADAKLTAARESGATRLQIAQMEANTKRELAVLSASLKAATATDKPLTGREARYADTVAIAGNEAIAGINNIINLPKEVTGGFWGSGLPKMQGGTGMFEAPIGALKNSLTPESVQRYNAEITNIGKNYSRILSGGLQASVSDMDSFEKQFRINENDKPLTALTKLAQMRQTFERAAEIKLNSASTPKEQKALWEDWLGQVKESIPLSVNDINKIANTRDKTKTFKQVLDETKKSVTSQEGKEAVSKSGKPIVFKNGKWEYK